MTYDTPKALRMALEQRLLAHSRETGVSLDRLRRRVMFERILVRLHTAEPGRWVLKGGMALEVRLHDGARLTKDIDLGLRDDIDLVVELRDRLVEALGTDPHGDGFVLTVGPAQELAEDGGILTWRVKVAIALAGKAFGGIQVDVSPRPHELETTDFVALPNSLEFAGFEAPTVEIIGINQHAAEKFHAMLKDFGNRENSRVRDLVDLVILSEAGLIDPADLSPAIKRVWDERDGVEPPPEIPSPPAGWKVRYERMALEVDLDAASFSEAVAVAAALWADMFPTEEKG